MLLICLVKVLNPPRTKAEGVKVYTLLRTLALILFALPIILFFEKIFAFNTMQQAVEELGNTYLLINLPVIEVSRKTYQ